MNAVGTPDRARVLSPRTRMMLRIRQIIDLGFADPDLTPAGVADRAGVSLRYLHLLFQDEPETVNARILRRRLEAVRDDLANPANTGVTISQICYAHGLSGAAYMSRAFRARFGLSPSAYRLSARDRDMP